MEENAKENNGINHYFADSYVFAGIVSLFKSLAK